VCLPGLDLVRVAPDYPICVDTDLFRVLGKAKLILIREESMTGAKPEKDVRLHNWGRTAKQNAPSI
jgi:hypothetical protein